jgi:hypothetical protein
MKHPGSPPNQRGEVVHQGAAFVFRPEFMWGGEFSFPTSANATRNPTKKMPFAGAIMNRLPARANFTS